MVVIKDISVVVILFMILVRMSELNLGLFNMLGLMINVYMYVFNRSGLIKSVCIISELFRILVVFLGLW